MVFDEPFLLHANHELAFKKRNFFMGLGWDLFFIEYSVRHLCPLDSASIRNLANHAKNVLLFYFFCAGLSLGRATRAAAVLVSTFTGRWSFGAQYRNFFASSALFRKFDLKFGDFFVLAA